MAAKKKVHVDLAPAYDFLLEPMRYKVAYGGRGAGKSWAFADTLLGMGHLKKLRILCAREHQNSIRDSVHQLLSDRIAALNLGDAYTIGQNKISGKRTGTTFTFTGLRINPSDLKSLEGTDICWIEEGRNVSKHSLDILTPTIRRPGSEIWITFNPELETDEVYQRYVVHEPDNCITRHVSYLDNPYFTKELDEERLACMKRDPDGYLTIWMGRCRVALEGAVYGQELRDLTLRGGVLRVPYDRTKPVHTAWDLGWADMTSIILFQQVGYEYRILGYIEDRHHDMAWYVEQLKSLPYIYGHHYMPHDADNHTVMSSTSPREMIEDMFSTHDVHIIPKTDDSEQHSAVRWMLPNCVFDEKNTMLLRNRLASYHYGVRADGTTTKIPLHDISSHGCKAFAMMALGYSEGHSSGTVRRVGRDFTVSGWMAA